MTVSSSASPDVARAQQVLLLAVSTLAELRESNTQNHILRLEHYVRALVQQLLVRGIYADVLTPDYVDNLCRCLSLYDMGTVGIPDRILLKPGPLTEDEMAIMRTHTTQGFEAIVRAEQTLGYTSPLLEMAKQMTLSHQEKWNGSGYPQGLTGVAIPLAARLVALADVYDVLISDKVYKKGMPHERAVAIILAESAVHFDPQIVDAFMVVHGEFEAIARRFQDSDADMQKKIEYMANAIAETTIL